MRRIDAIRQRLETALGPLHLNILDESLHHAGHAGARSEGETHFRIDVVSQKFQGLNAVARHRLIYAALEGLFSEGLHAIEINARAPGE